MSIKYLPLTSIALAIALAGCRGGSGDNADDYTQFQSVERQMQSLNSDWTFQIDYSDVAATEGSFDDSNWQEVTIPHVWDLENGQSGNGYFYGESTYRKTVNIASIDETKRYYLEFQGAALISTLFVNGEEVGQHNGGFSTFRFDITDYLAEGDNSLVVQLDNRLSSMQPDVDGNFGRETFLPLDAGADFTWWGGIYRDVNLLTVDDVSIDAEDFGGPGVYLSQKAVSDTSATVEAAIHLRNKSETDFSGNVLLTVKNAEDGTVKSIEIPASIPAGDVVVLTEEFSIDNPHLWNGVNDPYLYQVYAQILENDEVIDQVKQPLGLRYFEFRRGTTAEDGFVLNGNHYPLRGVAMHQDYMDMGWATKWEQRKESIDIVRDMGANTIRFSHYPHNLDTQAYSDELGLINWVEIPMINAVSLDPSYLESAKQQLKELIKQHYNHPSVGVWGITNEIMASNPISSEETAQLVQQLSNYAKELDGDAYRKTAQAAVLFDEIDSPLHDVVEVNSYNRYDGWYMGTTSDFGEFLDSFLSSHTDKVLGVSEYGAGSSAYWHTDTPIMGDHTEQYSQYYHEESLKQIEERPYLWGTHVWNMFDFTVSHRDEGDIKGRNDKGLVSLDRKLKKDAFYLYQAAWADKPVVHINSKRQMDSCPTDVGLTTPSVLCGPQGTTRSYLKVYSNLDSLSLYIDGELVSTKTQDDNAYGIVYEWDNLGLAPGSYDIEVRGESDGNTYSDQLTFIRVASESNSLTSSSIAVVDDIDNPVGYISQLPSNITLGELKALVITPPGATIDLNGQNDSYVVQVGDVLTVTSESNVEREYTIKDATNIAYARPVADNGIKGVFFEFDNTQNLTDDQPDTLWTALSAEALSTATIDLQHVFYIDEVEIDQGDAYGDYPGDVYVDGIGSNVVVVDHTVYVEDQLLDQPVESWKVQSIGKNVRVDFSPEQSTKTLSVYGRIMNAPIISDIRVFGGLIYSDDVAIDYRNYQIDLSDSTGDVSTLGSLISSINTVPAQHGVYDVQIVDSSDNAITDTSKAPTAGDKLVATRYKDGLEYVEVYTIVD